MRRPKSHGDFCALDVKNSDLEENDVVIVERRGTLSKDIDDVNVSGDDDVAPSYNLTAIMARLNTLGIMVALQFFTFVFVLTMTDASHVFAGVAAGISFTLSLSILLLRVVAPSSSSWRSMSLPILTMGLYATLPAFVVSMIIYVATTPSTSSSSSFPA